MLIATFRLELGNFALEVAFDEVPGMTVEAERIAAHSTEWTMPCVWVAADDFDAVDEALSIDPTVASVVETDAFGSEKHYHIDWVDEVDELITKFVDREGTVLQAEATADGWRLQMRFATRDQLDTFRRLLDDLGSPYELVELFEPGAPRQTAGNVTPTQRDALVTATEQGYYDVPREVSSRDLADELDMSHQSLSELLRRGTGRLVESTLMVDDLDTEA